MSKVPGSLLHAQVCLCELLKQRWLLREFVPSLASINLPSLTGLGRRWSIPVGTMSQGLSMGPSK